MGKKTAHSSPLPIRMNDGDRWTMKSGNLTLEICRIGSNVYASVLPKDMKEGGSDFSPVASMVIRPNDLIIMLHSSATPHASDTPGYQAYVHVPPVPM